MKTKREVLEQFAEFGHCEGIRCQTECPYYTSRHCPSVDLHKIGAKALLRMFPEKLEPRVFDKSKILTCVTADKAKVGMKGYFADNLPCLENEFKINKICILEKILTEFTSYRFAQGNSNYALFYPIDEVEE